MEVVRLSPDIAYEYSEKVNTEFAIEAARYNKEINNKNDVLAIYDNGIKGLLYYRFIHRELAQLINIHSEIKGGGTVLFDELCRICRYKNIKYIYFYITNNADKFYEKFGIKPLGDGEYKFTLIDVNKNNVYPDHLSDFIKSKIR